MSEAKEPYWQTLPDGFRLLSMPHENRIYITFRGRMVVTKETGSPRFFKGMDEATRIRAHKWIYSFCDGYQDKYQVEGGL